MDARKQDIRNRCGRFGSHCGNYRSYFGAPKISVIVIFGAIPMVAEHAYASMLRERGYRFDKNTPPWRFRPSSHRAKVFYRAKLENGGEFPYISTRRR